MAIIKTLHVIASMDPQSGGVCMAVRMMIKGLDTFECINEVVCMDEPESIWVRQDPFITHALGPGKTPWRYNSRLLLWLKDNCMNYNTVILHGLWLYNGYAVKKAFLHFSIKNKSKDSNASSLPKLYIMPHGMLDPYFQQTASRKIKAIRNKIYWRITEMALINNADGLLFTCKEELLLARTTFPGYQPKKEVVVGLGVDAPPVFNPAMQASFESCSGLKGEPYILFLGRIHEKKGIDLLLNALSEVYKNSEKDQIPKLAIAGPGLDSSYGSKLQAIINKNQLLKDMVVFAGMLSGDAKWGAFYGCEAFVLTSHQENYGISIVEALACGKPVIISRQVNIWREIAEGGAGIINEDTASGTSSSMHTWKNLQSEDRRNMSFNATQSYKKYFSMEAAANSLYKEIATDS